MSDLISRSALVEVIKNVQEHMREANAKPVSVDAREIFTLFIEMVNAQPPVEAVPVVHGEWVSEYINRYGHPCHCCSVCGFKASYQDKNFCPNCGADMRKKVVE